MSVLLTTCPQQASSSEEASDAAPSAPTNSAEGSENSDESGTDNAERPCSVQVSDCPVPVCAPEALHSSWADWAVYLKKYASSTRQIIRVSMTVSCDLRNKRLAKTVAAREGLDVPYVPTQWATYQRTYICTHGWRTKDRSTGVRPKQFVRGTGCPFRFVVQVVEEEGQWLLRVKNGVYHHNHVVGTAHFKTYAENRKLEDSETRSTVREMVKYGRKRARIYEYLLDKGESLVKKDVDNIVQRVKAEFRGGLDDDDTCAQALTEFAAMDGNVATVDETDAGHSGVMSMTSRHQRDMTVRFPELLLVDCTHKTNR